MKKQVLMRGVLAAAAALTLAASAAEAQVVIVTFDSVKIGRDSLAAKDLASKLNTIGTQIRSELEAKGKAAEAENTALSQILEPLNDQARAQRINGDLKARWEAFQKQGQDYQKLTERRRAEVEITNRCAEDAFRTQLTPVIDEVARAHNATIMVDRSAVAWSSPAIDVTTEILQKLDAKVKAITVTKANLPDPVPDNYKPTCS